MPSASRRARKASKVGLIDDAAEDDRLTRVSLISNSSNSSRTLIRRSAPVEAWESLSGGRVSRAV
jgi:hypothetical protein